VNLNLDGKYALVTGGTHGIGKEIAISLAKLGCNVAVFSRDSHKVENMNDILSKICKKSISISADALDKSDLTKVAKKIEEEWGGIDILVNNVGGGGRWGAECILDTDNDVWEEVFNKNVSSSVFFTKFFLPFMMKNMWGRVICISSIYGKEIGGRPWFNIAKSSQNVLMKNLALNKKYSSCSITFNSVAPGPIYIENTGWATLKKEKPEEFEKYVSNNIPMGSMGTPEDVANIVTFLCTDYSKLINGAVISCDGGQGVCI